MNANERSRLIDDLLDGDISEADFLVLEAEMRVNPEARQAYYQRLKLNRAIVAEAKVSGAERAIVHFPNGRSHARSLLGIAAAILVVMGGILGWRIGQVGDAAEFANGEPLATAPRSRTRRV